MIGAGPDDEVLFSLVPALNAGAIVIAQEILQGHLLLKHGQEEYRRRLRQAQRDWDGEDSRQLTFNFGSEG